MVAVTRLGLYGGPRPPYASFAGKTEAPVVVATESRARGGYVPAYEGEQPFKRADRDRKAAEKRLDEVLREAYAKATGEAETPADVAEIAATVSAHVTGPGRKPTKTAPAIARVDFEALARDEARADKLLEIANRRQVQIDDDEAAALVLLMCA